LRRSGLAFVIAHALPLTVPSEPAVGSAQDEAVAIDENIAHMNEFLKNIVEKGSSLPPESVAKVQVFRNNWRKFFSSTESEVEKCDGITTNNKEKKSVMHKELKTENSESDEIPKYELKKCTCEIPPSKTGAIKKGTN